MKRIIIGIWAVLLLTAGGVQAQVIKEGSITTAGADCTTSTRCSELIDMKGIPSIGIIIDLGTSGTFQFEYSLDATSLTTGTWTALIDDVNGASSTTTDVSPRFFANPGYKFIRIRASAINGDATYKVLKGSAPLRSTASITGGGDASLTEQQNQTALLTTLAGTVTAGEVAITGSITAGASTTDPDDASIAVAQTNDNVNALTMAYDGSVWRRLTFGTAGTASAQVITVQGITSMTPILATLSGTNTVAAVTSITNALPAGTNNIGNVDIASITAGDNNIGNVDIVTMPADATELPAAAALADNTANPTVPAVASFSMCWDGSNWDRCSGSSADTELPPAASLADSTANPSIPAVAAYNMCYNGSTWDRCTDTALPAGDNNVGNVDIASAIPAGTNNIGDVDVATIAAGDNNIGNVDLASAIPAGTNNIGDVDVLSIAAGDNNIGNVDIASITAGDNNIGNVDVVSAPAIATGTNSIGEVTGASDKPIIACDNVGVINTNASGNVELVALSGSTTIYVCSYTLSAEATVDVRLIRGTGTACATGDISISGTYAFSTTTGFLGLTKGTGLGMITKGTAGDAFCLETSSGVQINGEYTYAQY